MVDPGFIKYSSKWKVIGVVNHMTLHTFDNEFYSGSLVSNE